MNQDRREIISRAANFAESAHLDWSGPTPEGCAGIALALAATAAADALDELTQLCREQAAPAAPPIMDVPTCPACDGSGVQREGPPVVLCELCDGSGLAHPDTAALWRLAFLLGTMEDHEELRCPPEHDDDACLGQCASCWLAWARAGEGPDDDFEERAEQAFEAAADRAFGQPAAVCGAPVVILVEIDGGLVSDVYTPDGLDAVVAIIDRDCEDPDTGQPALRVGFCRDHREVRDGQLERAQDLAGWFVREEVRQLEQEASPAG